MSGEEFNRTLKSFAHNILPDQKSLPIDHTIERIKFLDKNEKMPEGKDVRSKKVGTDVTAYFDYFLHTMYIKSTSSVIYFPEDCTHMFYKFHELEEIDFFKSPKNVRVDVKLPGNWIIYDNEDGRSDDGVYYTSLCIDDNSHIYRHRYANYPFYDDDMTSSVVEPATVSFNSVLPDSVTMDNITYRIDENGSATVTKITSAGKVKIDNATVNGVVYPVTAISDGACQGNKKIKSLVIGSSVREIGKNAFKGCKSLESVTIKANKSLTIGKGAFKKINKRSSIKVKGVKESTKKKLIKAIGD